MNQILQKYGLLLLALILFILLFSVLIFSFFNTPSQTSNNPTNQTATPTTSPNEYTNLVPAVNPPSIDSLPRNGNVIDLSSTTVQLSQAEIAKLTLPYKKDFISKSGVSVSILIPSSEFQDDPWKLTSNVFGIDYMVVESDDTYSIQESAFIEASNYIFTWVEANNSKPNRIIYRWGDTAEIQQKATLWLEKK